MKNKNVGFLVIGIAAVMAVIVLLFNRLIKTNLSFTCSHGTSCQMYDGLNIQTWISLVIVAVILLIGLFLIFTKESEKIVLKTKTIREKRKKVDYSSLDLDKNEKQVLRILESENGALFQKDLMEKIGVGKVGITRLLDKLEAKQLIERKRRGMNNIVVLR